jgi:hypothetical protein
MSFRVSPGAARRALLPLVLAATCGAVPAQPAAPAESGAAALPWRLAVRSDRHSDVLSLSDIQAEAYEQARARASRNLLYLEDEARLERRGSNGWHLGLLARSSATLLLNRDAVEVIAQAAGAPAGGDRRWPVSARLRGFSGAGLERGRELPLGSQWRLGWSVQTLALTRLRDRRISGSASYDAATGAYGFGLHSSELNDRMRFPFQQSFAAHGMGLLFGGELGWQDERFALALSVRDAGWLRWSGLPRQEADLSSSVRDRDADGFLLYGPLVQGRYSQSTYSRYWPARWALRGQWQAQPSLALGASLQTVPGFGVLPAVSLQQRWAGDVQTTLGWRFHERRASAAVDWRGWRVEAGIDRLGGAQSRLLALSWATAL